MFDILSYIMGRKKGASEGGSSVVVISENIVCTDDGDGNITIETEAE